MSVVLRKATIYPPLKFRFVLFVFFQCLLTFSWLSGCMCDMTPSPSMPASSTSRFILFAKLLLFQRENTIQLYNLSNPFHSLVPLFSLHFHPLQSFCQTLFSQCIFPFLSLITFCFTFLIFPALFESAMGFTCPTLQCSINIAKKNKKKHGQLLVFNHSH